MKILVVLFLVLITCPVFSQNECKGFQIAWKIHEWDSDSSTIAGELLKAGYSIYRYGEKDVVTFCARRVKTDTTPKHEIQVSFKNGIIENFSRTGFFDSSKFINFLEVLQQYYIAIGESVNATNTSFNLKCVDKTIQVNLNYIITQDFLTEQFTITRQPALKKEKK